jgi:hypothetical protein
MCVKPLIATASDRAMLAERVRDVRARVAFYASTPAYLGVFESEGHGAVARTLQGHARAQRWDEMPGLVTDEMLDAYAVIGIYDEIAAKLHGRYGHLATSLEFAIPPSEAGDDAMLRRLIDGLRRGAA